MPERIGGRVVVETPLDLLAAGAAREPVDHRDALAAAVGPLDGLLQNGAQMALRPLAVLGEDEDAARVPARRRTAA